MVRFAFFALGSVLKLRLASRAVLLSCAGLLAFANPAAAQRAPIVYAGQGGGAAPAAPEQVASLPGGSENSYGYGRNASAPRAAAVIDLRRPSSGAERARVVPVVSEQPVPLNIDNEQDAPAPAASAPSAPRAEEGTAWLERERVGPPYEANGQWYVPTPEPGYAETGTASWYGPQFHGQRTASGEVFDQEALSAAHPTLPIPSLVQVTNLENGREVIVRVNDRGPFVGQRLIDLSRGAAEVLGFEAQGHARVHVRYLGPAPRRVNADGSMAAPSPRSPPPAAPMRSEEEGPASLLPPAPASAGVALAGAPVEETPYTPAPATYAAPAAMDGYFVQVGAYSDLSNAHRVRDEVGAAGPVVVDIRQTAAGELFRVRVGPLNHEEAEAARRHLASLGYGETILAAR